MGMNKEIQAERKKNCIFFRKQDNFLWVFTVGLFQLWPNRELSDGTVSTVSTNVLCSK